MLLRSITKHIKDQNWFAVALDFFIVVIGVFIGIQVANWNEVRAERARGENIKSRLAAEFIEIESEYARHVRDITTWITNTDELAEDILVGAVDVKSPEYAERLFENGWRSASGGSNTVVELVSRGDMDLLNSPDLVERLLKFQALAERHVRSNEALYARLRLDDSTAQVAILAAIPPATQTDEFTNYLDEIISVPRLYVSAVNASNILQTDLMWHQRSLESACAILKELDEPCRASDAMAAETAP
ncbi:MAG: hypothetical protein AB8G18_19480 [Gammaproteobacteria bacterium]